MSTAILFSLCLIAALGLFFYQIWGRFNVLRGVTAVERMDRLPERVQALIVYFFGQKKFVRPEAAIVRERTAGWMHFFIFWGFTVLGVQVVTLFARAYFPNFHLPLLSPHLLGGPVLLLEDLLELAVLIALGVAFTRWFVTKPARLFGYLPPEARLRGHSHWEAYLILSCIGIIMIGGLLYNAGRYLGMPGDAEVAAEMAWLPISRVLASSLSGVSPETALTLSTIAWWAHNLSVLVLLNFLPVAKHFHVITSAPNVFFKKLEPTGQLSKQDLENATRYGTSHIDQFNWKQVLDMYSCTECGRCSSQCPATATGKPLATLQLLLDLLDYLYEHQGELIEKRVNAKPVE